MKPAPFDYVRPSSLAEATAALGDSSRLAVALGGGQSLMPLLALRVAPADVLIDLGRLPDLKQIEETDTHIRIGAGVTHAAIEDGHVPDPADGILKRVATNIAYRAVRNHGTIGGSLALADPAADWPAVLLALNASLTIVGANGKRAEPIDDFFLGAYTTSLQAGEIIASIDIPKFAPGTRTGHCKVVRKSGAFANAIGMIVRPPKGERVRAVLGGTATRPVMLPGLAAHLSTPQPDVARGTIEGVIGADLDGATPDADAYQRRVFTATLARAINEAFQ